MSDDRPHLHLAYSSHVNLVDNRDPDAPPTWGDALGQVLENMDDGMILPARHQILDLIQAHGHVPLNPLNPE